MVDSKGMMNAHTRLRSIQILSICAVALICQPSFASVYFIEESDADTDFQAISNQSFNRLPPVDLNARPVTLNSSKNLSSKKNSIIANEILITAKNMDKDELNEEIKRAAEELGLEIESQKQVGENTIAVSLKGQADSTIEVADSKELLEMLEDVGIEAEHNHVFLPTALSEQYFQAYAWSMHPRSQEFASANVQQAWSMSKGKTVTGQRIRIGVIDTGYLDKHPGFEGHVDIPNSIDLINKTFQAGDNNSVDDDPLDVGIYVTQAMINGQPRICSGAKPTLSGFHGTGVAGLIATAAPEAELVIIRVVGRCGANGIRNINMPLKAGMLV